MIAAFRSRACAVALSASFLVACQDKAPPPVRAEKATATASASATAAPSAQASAAPSAEASAAPAAEASAPAPSAEPQAAASSSASAAAGAATATEKARTYPPIPLPSAPAGILGLAAAEKLAKPGAVPDVKLLEPGDEPRAKLAYELAKGAQQRVEIISEATLGMRAGAESQPATAMPRTRMILDLTVKSKKDDGDAEIDVKLDTMALEPQGAAAQQKEAVAAMKQVTDQMKGLAWSYLLSSHGHIHDLKLSGAKNDPQSGQLMGMLTQAFEATVVKLPAEPVGDGARWQVATRIQSMGADLVQIETYTLKKRDGDRLRLDVAFTQLAANEAVSPPGMPQGTTAKIVAFKSSATGHSDLVIKRPSPDAAEMRTRTALDMSVKQGTTSNDIRVEQTMNVRYRKPKK